MFATIQSYLDTYPILLFIVVVGIAIGFIYLLNRFTKEIFILYVIYILIGIVFGPRVLGWMTDDTIFFVQVVVLIGILVWGYALYDRYKLGGLSSFIKNFIGK